MIAKVFIFACATFGLVAGSCFQLRTEKQCSVPVSFPVVSNNVLSGGLTLTRVLSGNNNLLSAGCGSCSSLNNDNVLVTLGNGNNLVSNAGSNVFSNSGSNLVIGPSPNGFFDGNVNGPETAPLPLVQAPPVTLPTVESPVVTLSSPPIPAPRVLASRCVCTKTIVKPQVYQRVVTVPKVQRYLKRTVTPVVENLVYKSKPLNGGNYVATGGSGPFVVSRVSSGSSPVFVSGNSSPLYVTGSSQNRVC